jgi:hypothetical protein
MYLFEFEGHARTSVRIPDRNAMRRCTINFLSSWVALELCLL